MSISLEREWTLPPLACIATIEQPANHLRVKCGLHVEYSTISVSPREPGRASSLPMTTLRAQLSVDRGFVASKDTTILVSPSHSLERLHLIQLRDRPRVSMAT